MPLYEYHCSDCDEVVEVLLRSSTEQPSCPKCSSQRLTKQLSVVASPAAAERGDSMPSAETCGRPQCQSGCMFD